MIISRRTVIFAAVIGIVIGAGVGIFVSTRSTPILAAGVPENSKQAKAQAPKNPATCLADTNALPAGASQDSLVRTLTGQLNDVTAGTNVDIVFNSDNGTTVTGSQRYAGDWGSYNFSANRSGDDWKITSFVACK